MCNSVVLLRWIDHLEQTNIVEHGGTNACSSDQIFTFRDLPALNYCGQARPSWTRSLGPILPAAHPTT